MKDLIETLGLFAPPLWLVAAVATVFGVVLLSVFIDTLHDNVRRAEQLQHTQRLGAARHAAGDAGRHTSSPQARPWRIAVPTNLQQ